MVLIRVEKYVIHQVIKLNNNVLQETLSFVKTEGHNDKTHI